MFVRPIITIGQIYNTKLYMANFLTFFNEIIIKNHLKMIYFTLKMAQKMQFLFKTRLFSIKFIINY
jgi:hypothetical protein